MKIEIYEKNRKTTKLTLTPDRITIKVSPKDAEKVAMFGELANLLCYNVYVDFSYRGIINITPAYLISAITNGSKTRKIIIQYYYNTGYLLLKESVLVNGEWREMDVNNE